MVSYLEVFYPTADSKDNTGVFMTNHVARSCLFLMSSVNFFATKLAIPGGELQKESGSSVSPLFPDRTMQI